jgi:hypothetical protein
MESNPLLQLVHSRGRVKKALIRRKQVATVWWDARKLLKVSWQIQRSRGIIPDRSSTEKSGGAEAGGSVASSAGQDRRDQREEPHVALIKSIPRVALILVFMPILLFAIVLWAPIRKMMAA